MRLHSIFLGIAALGLAAPARAQDPERAAVIATVQKMFDAMRTRDTALLNQAFDSTGRLVGVSTRNGPATVTFHRNSTFTHCGVDAFMLVKVGANWKITQVADTRRTTGCTHTEP